MKCTDHHGVERYVAAPSAFAPGTFPFPAPPRGITTVAAVLSGLYTDRIEGEWTHCEPGGAMFDFLFTRFTQQHQASMLDEAIRFALCAGVDMSRMSIACHPEGVTRLVLDGDEVYEVEISISPTVVNVHGRPL